MSTKLAELRTEAPLAWKGRKPYRVLIVSPEAWRVRELDEELTGKGFVCLTASDTCDIDGELAVPGIEIAVVDMTGSAASRSTKAVRSLFRDIKAYRHLPVIVILSRDMLQEIDFNLDVDDFVVERYDVSELATRMKRVLRRKNSLEREGAIACDDLVIDLARCEVTLGGKLLELTFKEYGLLKLLATNAGRAFTREALLNEVWGYDYYGGDRTVDVHVRRLRSKLETSRHIFIETVRNIGYRFRKMQPGVVSPCNQDLTPP